MSTRIARPKEEKTNEQRQETPNTPNDEKLINAQSPVENQTVNRRDGLKILLENPENSSVIKKLIITTVIMFTVPFFMFYIFQNLDYYGMPLLHMYFRDRTLVGGIGALASVQIIIMVYIFIAFTEGDERLEEHKKLKKE